MLLYLKTCSFKETNFQRKAEEDDHVHPKQQRIIHVTLHPKFNQNPVFPKLYYYDYYYWFIKEVILSFEAVSM